MDRSRWLAPIGHAAHEHDDAGQKRRHAAGDEPAFVLAEFHALLGEREPALRYLRQSVAAREPLALTMRIDPLLRNLRGDPEFRRLAARVGRAG